MSYSVIYLWDENKNFEVKHKCKICEKIKRNVIEPVAVFVPAGQEEKLKEKLLNLSSEELQEELEKLYENVSWYRKDPKNYQTCIFHCDKENEIWIENFNDGYEEYAKRRDEAIEKEEPFGKDFKINWNKKLVDEFWRIIRTYRFAVDYVELWKSKKVKQDWDKFLNELEKKEYTPPKKKLNQNKELILFNLRNLYPDDKKIFYDFQLFKFPKFYDYINDYYRLGKAFNFFYKEENLYFNKTVNFWEAIFYDSALFNYITFNTYISFWKANFNGKTIFENTIFNEKTDFDDVKFNNIVNFQFVEINSEISFRKVIFNNIVEFQLTNFNWITDFKQANFKQKVNFTGTSFQFLTSFENVKFNELAIFFGVEIYNNIYFGGAIFNGKTGFIKSIFSYTVKFNSTTFNHKVEFDLEKNTGNFIFDNIQLTNESKIKIRNLKAVCLVLRNINNLTENFFFYDTEIIGLNEYEKYLEDENIRKDNEFISKLEKIPNLLIKNSHLNKMKFINCDFSKAKHIKIESSDLTEVKFLATDWGDITEDRICPDLFKNDTKKARDIYRQLKLTLDNHRDYFSANGFYALEMKAQEKMLQENLFKKYENSVWNDLKILLMLIFRFKKLPKEKFELLVLKIHKLASDFGQSWLKPLRWLFLFSFITSFIYQWKGYSNLLDGLGQTINSLNSEKGFFYSMLDCLKLYFQFIEFLLSPILLSIKNIAEITKTIKGEFDEGNLWIIFILFLYTIISGFLIYQFAGAVRRKVKR